MATTSDEAPHNHSNSTKEEINNNNNSSLLLPSWTAIATRLLSTPTADGTSWYVMDQVKSADDFVVKLKQELTNNGLLKRMTLAKTQGERQSNDIMALLESNGLLLDSSHNANASTSSPSSSSIRGDKSTFVGRDLVQQSNFPLQFPHLQRLIRTFQDTAAHHLSHCMEFDFSLTSVQIAEFPGDGSSGYRRHCDRRGNLCRQETKATTSTSERLLTGVYYLTPDDWDHQQDGGCLRLFVGDEGTNHDTTTNHHVDVAPYRNRMIVFRADGVEHQVMPSHQRSRLALTIWLYGKIRDNGEASQSNTKQPETMNVSKNSDGNENESNDHSNNHHPSSTTVGPPPLPIRQVTDVPTNGNKKSPNSLPTIFVSIAAYRDSETGPTIRHLKAMATHPERVFVGLILQLDTAADKSILQGLPTHDEWYQTNVRCLQLEAKHAMGPCYARALGQSLCRGEDYVLQIDSHMRFRKHWDTYLIQELEQLISNKENDKVMLTAYPVGYHLPNQIPTETRGTVLVPWKFDDNGLLRQRGRLFDTGKEKGQQQRPISCLLYAAGFNFSRLAVLQDCPYDEQLHHLFFGEELSMAVRLYTHGYDLYAPVESVCYHLWSRAHRPTHTSTSGSAASQNGKSVSMNDRERQWHEQRKEASLNVVRRQLTAGTDHAAAVAAVEGYRGLGSVRTVQQFADSLGVDFAKGIIVNTGAPGFLPDLEYVQDSTSTQTLAPESLEGQIHALDAKSQNLIAAFL